MKDIVTYAEPSKELKQLTIADNESGGGKNVTGEKASLKAGAMHPYVDINNMVFNRKDIQYMKIDLSGFLPELTLTIEDIGGLLKNRAYPMDGDVVSILIRSKNSDFKPVRQDYRIMSVSSVSSAYGAETFTISAKLDVPELFVDTIKAFDKKTSWDTLKEIAKDIGLGFASNVESTNDSMTRLCCNIPLWDFITNDVVPGTYTKDEAFYVCYIDQYYYLNLVEVHQLLIDNNDFDKITNVTWRVDHGRDDEEEEPFLNDFILSNHQELSATGNYISSYALVNNSGDVSMKNGYRNNIQYYDKKEEKLVQNFLETLNDSGTTSEKIILKGRDKEDHTKQIRNLYFGDFFSDNVHKDYYYAKIANYLNEDELNKINLVITTPMINPALTKYKIVPVQIVNKDRAYRDWERAEREEENGESTYSINRLLSDFYVATNISYVFDGTSKAFYTEATLSKREFLKIPGKEKSDFK